jgi:hypothetical protein
MPPGAVSAQRHIELGVALAYILGNGIHRAATLRA